MTRVHEFIENEITFGVFMLVFWLGAIVFTMSSHLAIHSF